MRVTNKMMSENVLRNLHSGLARIADSNQQLSSGKRISRPHDDPVAVRKALGMKSSLTHVEQYVRNINQGLSWLQTTESAVYQVVDSLNRVRELAARGANGSLSQTDLNAIKEEVIQLREHFISLSDTQYDGRYVFGGTSTLTKPYDGTLIYQGNAGDIDYEIGKGINVKVNTDGQALFDPVLSILNDLETHLSTQDYAAVSADLGQIDAAIDNTLEIEAQLGATTKRLELAKDRLSEENLNISQLLSETEDADIAEVLMNLKMQENIYRASLGSAARIIQPSLLDFLR